jgi:hypothetical protein
MCKIYFIVLFGCSVVNEQAVNILLKIVCTPFCKGVGGAGDR